MFKYVPSVVNYHLVKIQKNLVTAQKSCEMPTINDSVELVFVLWSVKDKIKAV